ncbi:MAG: PH domain-containing protein [Nitriliruptoraceae bacterium]
MPSEPDGSPPPPSPVDVHGARPDFREPRQLHPASILLGIPLMQFVQAVFVPVVATLAAPWFVTAGLLVVVAVIGLIVRILDWRMRTFSFDGEVLRVDHGVLSRNHRSLDIGRIQQVEIQRGAIQRLVGLAAIRVETAGSASEPEVDLRVLPEADAVALRRAVRASQERLAGRASSEDGAGADQAREILRVPMVHVVLASITGARLLVLPAVIGGGLQFAGNQLGPFMDDAVDRMVALGLAGRTPTFNGPDWRLILLGTLAVLLLTIAAAIVTGVLRDGNFRIRRIDDDLHVSRGVLATRESVVPLRRVQLVEVKRNWLRRVLGFATVRIRSAGGSAEGDGRVSVPLLRAGRIDDLLGELLPGVPGVPDLRSHPPTALRRALFRWLRPAVLLLAAVWLAPELVGVLDIEPLSRARAWLLLLLPVNAALAVIEYRHLAHGVTELVVAARSGALSITTSIAPVVKVQAVTSTRGIFQRRLGLTTLIAHVAGPGAVVVVMDAGRAEAAELHGVLGEHAASPTPISSRR